VSVDTVRYYQARGLLPQPQREGRVAWYSDVHAARIRQIRQLRTKGLTLDAIGRVVRDERDPDPDLAAAVAEARDGRDEGASLSLDEFAAVSGVPASLIQAVEREGIGIGRSVGGEIRYTSGDIDVVRTALRLLEFGLPLAELLALARDADRALRELAERAVDLFDESVRKPIRDSVGENAEGAAQMVEAFHELLPAVTTLVAHHFRSLLLASAEERIQA
jgi:DNA-binding transcriptional MerR regulator